MIPFSFVRPSIGHSRIIKMCHIIWFYIESSDIRMLFSSGPRNFGAVQTEYTRTRNDRAMITYCHIGKHSSIISLWSQSIVYLDVFVSVMVLLCSLGFIWFALFYSICCWMSPNGHATSWPGLHAGHYSHRLIWLREI